MLSGPAPAALVELASSELDWRGSGTSGHPPSIPASGSAATRDAGSTASTAQAQGSQETLPHAPIDAPTPGACPGLVGSRLLGSTVSRARD